MKYFITAFLVLASTQSFAKGPFGDATSKNFSSGRDQSGCTADRLLENTIEDTGIDLLDGSVSQVWNCENGEGPATAGTRRCPYDQYMKAQSYKCYSNTPKGFPYVCVAGAKSELVEEKYAGDQKPQKIPRVRFSQLFVFQGDQKQKNIEMDQNGCSAAKVRGWDSTGLFSNGSTESEHDKCLKMLKDSLDGGYIYPPRKAKIGTEEDPGVKFCEGSKSRDDRYVFAHLTAIKNLYHCYEAFPNLDTLLKNSKTTPAKVEKNEEAKGAR